MTTTNPTDDHQRCATCGTFYHVDEVAWFEDSDGDPQCEFCREASAESETEAQQESDIGWVVPSTANTTAFAEERDYSDPIDNLVRGLAELWRMP